MLCVSVLAFVTGLAVGLAYYHFSKTAQSLPELAFGSHQPALFPLDAARTVQRETCQLLLLLFARMGEQHIRRRILTRTAAVVLAYALGTVLYCLLSRETAFLASLDLAFPGIMLIDILTMALCCLVSANRGIYWLVFSLSLLGSLLALANGETARALFFYRLAGLILAGIALAAARWLQLLQTKKMLVFLMSLSTALYICTSLFGITAEGTSTRIWIRVGGVLIQTSELAKLLAFLAVSILYSKEELPELQKLFCTAAILFLNGCFLIYLHELGTLLVMIISISCAAVVSLRSRRLLIGAGALALLGFQAACWLGSKGVPLFSAAYAKLSGRLAGFLQVQANSQTDKALHELHLAKWFGTTGLRSTVPVAASDFIVIRLAMSLGMGTVFCVILLYIGLLWCALKQKQVLWGLGIVVQSLLATGSSCGLLPVIGVAPVLLGEGGSTQAVAFAMAALMLADSTHILLERPRRAHRGRSHSEQQQKEHCHA